MAPARYFRGCLLMSRIAQRRHFSLALYIRMTSTTLPRRFESRLSRDSIIFRRLPSRSLDMLIAASLRANTYRQVTSFHDVDDSRSGRLVPPLALARHPPDDTAAIDRAFSGIDR